MFGFRNLAAVKSSPVKFSLQGSQQFAALPMNATEAKHQLASERHFHWVGPMPVDEFLQAFLDIDQNRLPEMPDISQTFFDGMPSNYKKETEMYQPFIDLVNNAQIAPTLKMLNTSNKEDPNADRSMKNKPDITAYNPNADITTADPLSFSQAQLLFEFKPKNKTVDPFEDLSASSTDNDIRQFVFEPPAGGRRECRGQIACYARAWMANQHRTHCFVVYIGDPWARIVRFDRTGAVVTERFNIRKNSRPLLEFLWRFSWATPEIRGTDTTVTIVKDENEIREAQWKPKLPRRVLKLAIPDGGPADNPGMREVLVWGPLSDPWNVVRRATRAYPGWDPKEKKLVFVKDSWRVIEKEISKESDILKTLDDAGVRNVPTFLYGDDLPKQTTRTQDFASAGWNRGGKAGTFSKRAHIRFAMKVIGIPLTKFKRSKDFVQAWFDALLAHEEAYTECKILHRDISLNNILLKMDGGGFLNDWDLARTLDDIEKGTWQFMSIALLGQPDKKHNLQDDLEAFFWVLLYVTLRYLTTSVIETGESVSSVMQIFDSALFKRKGSVGGAYKQQVIVQRQHIGDDFYVKDNMPLTELVDEIVCLLAPHQRVWAYLTTETKILAREKKISLEAAREVYLTANQGALAKFSTHSNMIALGDEALKKDWPLADEAFDNCDMKRTPRSPTSAPPLMTMSVTLLPLQDPVKERQNG